MNFFRGLFKVVIFVFYVSAFLLISAGARILPIGLRRRRFFFTRNVSMFCRVGLWLMNVKVRSLNEPPKEKNFLYVCNHMGILDIFILSSLRPTLFVTSVEMQQTPGLGQLCELGGCLFVERRSRAKIHEEILQIRKVLSEELSIGLYPEGTSTNGEKILPFKKSLLVGAVGTNTPILPIVLNYRTVDFSKVTSKNRDRIFWYGEMPFYKSFWNLLTLRECTAEIEFLEPILAQSEEDRREIANRAQKQIEAKFAPIL